jgi:hypothetical protein
MTQSRDTYYQSVQSDDSIKFIHPKKKKLFLDHNLSYNQCYFIQIIQPNKKYGLI